MVYRKNPVRRGSSVGDLPREKLISRGVRALSDDELIAILLGSGCRGRDVFKLSRQVRSLIDEEYPELCPHRLRAIPGIGMAKATLLCAGLEFSRRRITPSGRMVTQPSDLLPLLGHLAEKSQEHLVCITLNGAYEILENRVIGVGLLNRVQVHPREIYAHAISDRAAAVIIAHNHPSSDLSPSPRDIETTHQLVKAGELLGIPLLDHIIFSRDRFLSFKEEGII